MTEIERMDDFFAARAEGYDEHMLNNVEGCREGYLKMASLLPGNALKLLDLGCGTGLELEGIFKSNPSISVTGIDLSQAMLNKLKQKYTDKHITLINADYFTYDFGVSTYDAAVSFETLHHFTHEQKLGLYRKVYAALKLSRPYVECDYMVAKQSEEDYLFAEAQRIRREQRIPDGEFYHIDTPCTVENQLTLLKRAGFEAAEAVWRSGGTTIIVARKR